MPYINCGRHRVCGQGAERNVPAAIHLPLSERTRPPGSASRPAALRWATKRPSSIAHPPTLLGAGICRRREMPILSRLERYCNISAATAQRQAAKVWAFWVNWGSPYQRSPPPRHHPNGGHTPGGYPVGPAAEIGPPHPYGSLPLPTTIIRSIKADLTFEAKP